MCQISVKSSRFVRFLSNFISHWWPLLAFMFKEWPWKTKLWQKCVKILTIDRFLSQFCLKTFHECFLGRHKMCQKCIKKVGFVTILSYIWWGCFLKMFHIRSKNVTKTVKTIGFARFLSDLWNCLWHILNTFLNFDTFLPYIWRIFDRIWRHFGFWQFFVRILSVICHIFVFWHIFDTFLLHFWHILEMAGPTLSKSTEMTMIFHENYYEVFSPVWHRPRPPRGRRTLWTRTSSCRRRSCTRGPLKEVPLRGDQVPLRAHRPRYWPSIAYRMGFDFVLVWGGIGYGVLG